MNKVTLIGRLTKDPSVSVATSGVRVAKFILAVDRRGKKDEADFIACTAFDKKADFFEKYVTKGTKMAIIGHIQTGSYTNTAGSKVYTTDVIVEESEFCESKKAEKKESNDFMDVPGNIEADLPFA